MKAYTRFGLATLLVLAIGIVSGATAAPRLGRAVIAGVQGSAHVETPEGSFDVEEGMALSHGHSLTTDPGASVCSLLTPGALLCVRENSRVQFLDLQHATQGLPGEGHPEQGRITIYLERGAILMDGLKGPAGLDNTINLATGADLKLSRAECLVARDRASWHVFVEHGNVTVQAGPDQRDIHEGQTLTLTPPTGSDAPWGIAVADGMAGRAQYDFYVCRELFPSLEPLAADWSWENMDKAGNVVSDGSRIAQVTRSAESLDVSPTVRNAGDRLASFTPPTTSRMGGDNGVRRRVDMWIWYRGVGAVRGFNYLPRTAVNSTEMWQPETYDHATIDQELQWADNSGFNSVRVFLPYVVWQHDAATFKKEFTDFLAVANDHHLSVVPVLFDDYSPHGVEPYLGPQQAPVAGVHNSQWTPSPGHQRVADPQAWPDLARYVADLTGTFGHDRRILFWDLYNDPGRSGMGDKSLPLVETAFGWARATHPDQPITAGVNAFLSTPAVTAIMRRSDLVTFSGYQSRADLEGGLAMAGLRGRPVICTGWLDRTQDVTYDGVLPMFAANHVGWFQWGLVAGRSQMQLPASGKAAKSNVWAQAVLNADGKPYDEQEVKLIREFRFEER